MTKIFYAILLFVQSYISFYPLTVFICLILGGFNIPISEDILIITSALLAKSDHKLLIPSLLALYIGAILSDYLVYFWGYLISRGFASNKFISKLADEKKMGRIAKKVTKNAFLTNILCRFIPFGVRNAFFIYMGVSKYKFTKFMIYDGISCIISISTLFILTYLLGDKKAAIYMKIIGIVLFACILAFAIWFIFFSKTQEDE